MSGRRLFRFHGHSRIEADLGARHRSFRAAQAGETRGVFRLLVDRVIREISPERRQRTSNQARCQGR